MVFLRAAAVGRRASDALSAVTLAAAPSSRRFSATSRVRVLPSISWSPMRATTPPMIDSSTTGVTSTCLPVSVDSRAAIALRSSSASGTAVVTIACATPRRSSTRLLERALDLAARGAACRAARAAAPGSSPAALICGSSAARQAAAASRRAARAPLASSRATSGSADELGDACAGRAPSASSVSRLDGRARRRLPRSGARRPRAMPPSSSPGSSTPPAPHRSAAGARCGRATGRSPSRPPRSSGRRTPCAARRSRASRSSWISLRARASVASASACACVARVGLDAVGDLLRLRDELLALAARRLDLLLHAAARTRRPAPSPARRPRGSRAIFSRRSSSIFVSGPHATSRSTIEQDREVHDLRDQHRQVDAEIADSQNDHSYLHPPASASPARRRGSSCPRRRSRS